MFAWKLGNQARWWWWSPLLSSPLLLCACSIQGKWRTALAPMTLPPNPHSSTNCPLIFSAAFPRLILVLFFVCLLLLLLLGWGSVECSTGGRWPGRPEGGKWRKSSSSKAKSSLLLLKYSSKPSFYSFWMPKASPYMLNVTFALRLGCSLFRENDKCFYGVKKTFFS